jgi:hypothetical protein
VITDRYAHLQPDLYSAKDLANVDVDLGTYPKTPPPASRARKGAVTIRERRSRLVTRTTPPMLVNRRLLLTNAGAVL